MLRASIDEREDPDDEVEVVVDGVPFIASNEVIDGYGEEFEFYVDEHNMPAVRSTSRDEEQSSCGTSS